MASIIVPAKCSPREDAEKLYHAFKGLVCQKSTVINILSHRDADQRDLIQQEYESLYGDLRKRISNEFIGNSKKAITFWLYDPVTRDAVIIEECGLQSLTEIICTRTPSQLRNLRRAFVTNYHTQLEQHIESNASGDHKKLLLAYVSTTRYEGPEYDEMMVERDAKALHKPKDATFIRIFSESSKAHLAAVAKSYELMFGKSLYKVIKKETSGHFKDGLSAILMCVASPPTYFAKVLRKAMRGIGTDDSALLRVVVTRAEIDMVYIKVEYEMKYGKTLMKAVHSETSGGYRNFLLELIGK